MLWLLSPASRVSADVSVRLAGGLVSVEAHDVPLRDLLAEVGTATGTKITVDAGVGAGRTSVSFERLPVDEAFRRILRAHGIGLIYSARQLIEVRVYRDPAGPSGTPGTPAPPVPLQVLEILSQHRGRDPRVDSALHAAASDRDEAVRTSARALLRHSEP
ncbi:MAG: hypothetical protein HYR51_00405 [Candidatus Rokubacteria bacterium]|nr:hypothetical protein [Candidatus Rokubacteria bacterium]